MTLTCRLWGIVWIVFMSPFSWQCQNPGLLSLAFICIDWRVVRGKKIKLQANIPAVFSSYPRQRHEGLRPIQVGVHQDRRPGWDPCLGMWNVLDSKPSRASSCSTSIWTCGWWHSRRCWRQRRLPLAGPMASESGRTCRTKSSCLSVYKIE